MKKAFTLIELLVVIAIIAILAAILFPVFAQAKSAAKKTQSLSNIKGIALGTLLYSIDFDDYLEPIWNSPNGLSGGLYHEFYWPTLVYPYIKAATKQDGTFSNFQNSKGDVLGGGIYQSPSDPGSQINGSYAPNPAVLGGNDGWNSHSTTVFAAPTDKVMFIERGESDGQSGWYQIDPYQYTWTDSLAPVNGVPTKGTATNFALMNGDCDNSKVAGNNGFSWNNCSMLPRYRFNGTVVASFVDGHANSFHRTGTGTTGSSNLDWYKNIYVSETWSDQGPGAAIY